MPILTADSPVPDTTPAEADSILPNGDASQSQSDNHLILNIAELRSMLARRLSIPVEDVDLVDFCLATLCGQSLLTLAVAGKQSYYAHFAIARMLIPLKNEREVARQRLPRPKDAERRP